MSIYKEHRKKIKEDIINMSIQLFKTNGYEETSINQITKSVGIAKATFYNYFESKKDILFIWADRILQTLNIYKAFDDSKTIKENLYTYINLISDAILENEKLYLPLLREIQSIQLNNVHKDALDFKSLYIKILKSSIDSDQIKNKNLNLKANILNNILFMGIIDFFNKQSKSEKLEQYLKEITNVYLVGIYER